MGMNATRLYTKHGGYKQVLSVGRCKPYTGNGCRSICCNRELQNRNYWVTDYRDILLVMKKVAFKKKGRQELLANKVKRNDFEIVSIRKKEN
jgi:DNA topoisomerase-3